MANCRGTSRPGSFTNIRGNHRENPSPAVPTRIMAPFPAMPLTPGTRLGHYDVTALLGEGGMSQVWRARDTQL